MDNPLIPTVKYATLITEGDGEKTAWDFNFTGGYISPEHIKAFTENVATGELVIRPLTLIGPNTAQIVPAVADGLRLIIYRDTPKTEPLVDYSTGSILNEKNLDNSNKQAVFIAAELADRVISDYDFSNALLYAVTTATAAAATANGIDAKAQSALDNSVDAVATANAAEATANAASALATAAAPKSWFDWPLGSFTMQWKQQTSSYLSTVARKLWSAPVSPGDFGAVMDGVADDTAAWNAAVDYVSSMGGGTVELPSGVVGGKSRINGTVLVPGYVHIKLNNFAIIGAGIGVNWVFQSAYRLGGVLVTNVGTPLQTNNVLHMSISGGTITNCRGIQLQNCLDCCRWDELTFVNATDNVTTIACFYSSAGQMMSRGSSGLDERAAWRFDNNVNAQTFTGIACVDRQLSFEFSGGISAVTMTNLTAESGVVGMRIFGQINTATTQGCYFEALSSVGVDGTNPGQKDGWRLQGNYFNTMPVGIWVNELRSGSRITRDNKFVDVPVWVRATDLASYGTVEVVDTVDPTNALPRIPAEYQLGPNVNVEGRNILYDAGTGLPLGSNCMTSDLVVHQYGGRSGYSPGQVMFSLVSNVSSGPGLFDVLVTTKIVYEPFVQCRFHVKIGDADGTTEWWGDTGGTLVDLRSPTSLGIKSVAVENASGFVRLRFAKHAHPTGVFTAEGIVRILK